jgi:hypothetical protein
MMDVDDTTVFLRRLADNTTRARETARASFTPPTPADHDDAVALTPGTLRVDSLTGQIVIVERGQRAVVFVAAPSSQAS